LKISEVSEDVLDELRKNDERHLLTVLIFDQFEEFFFANPNPGDREAFYRFLNECLEISFVKVIVSLREDYLHYLLESEGFVEAKVMERDILARKIRYPLGNFTKDDAKEVIRSLTKRSQFRLEDQLIDKIVDDLARDSKGVRPIELQIVGSRIEAKTIDSLEKYRPKEELISDFLEEAIGDCGTENNDAANLLLYLLTDENFTRPLKTPVELLSELKDSGLEKVTDGQLGLILDILEGAGLIFVVPGKPERYQLVHDYLAEFVRGRRQGSHLMAELKAEQERRKKAEKRFVRFALAAGVTIAIIAILFSLIFRQQARIAKINETEALSQSAYALFLSGGKDLEALIAGVKAGKNYDRMNLSVKLKNQMASNFREIIYGVSVDFSPDGKMLASGSSDNTVKLWNVADGAEIATLKGHTDSFWSVDFSPDGKTLASGSSDNTVKLWNVADGAEIATLNGHTNYVWSVDFSPDGKMLASGSSDNTVKLWNQSGQKNSGFGKLG